MVDGVEVTGYVLLPDDARLSLVAAADYVLSFKESYEPIHHEGVEGSDRYKHFFDAPSFV